MPGKSALLPISEAKERKLKKAREEGQVPKSPELSGALVLLFPVLVLILLAPVMFKGFIQIIRFYFDRCITLELSDKVLFAEFLNSVVKMVLPISVTAIVAGVAANLIQNKGTV